MLQNSFCITDCKFSGPYVRRSNDHLRDYIMAMNPQATSVTAWRLCRSAISARLVYLREIARTIGGATGVFGGSRISCSLPLKIVEQNQAKWRRTPGE
jgi:hypothetical protein